MKKLFSCFVMLFILISAKQAFTDSVAGGVKEGNRLFKEEKLDEAIEQYSQAKKESPDSDIVNFNLGTAQYKKGQYQEAINSFTHALQTDDNNLEAKATYNLANSKYRLGSLQADSNLNSAASLYREALDYYKKSIELNGKDNDARFNHEIVEKQLKILLDRIKNQKQDENQKQEENQKQDDSPEGEKQESQSGEGQQEQNNQQEGDKQEASKDESGEQQDKSENQAESKESSSEKETASAGGDETVNMSPEEARMLLESYGQDEAREQVNEQMRGRHRGVLKDW